MCVPEGPYISSGSGSWLFLTGLLLLCRLTADRALGASLPSDRASLCLAVTNVEPVCCGSIHPFLLRFQPVHGRDVFMPGIKMVLEIHLLLGIFLNLIFLLSVPCLCGILGEVSS